MSTLNAFRALRPSLSSATRRSISSTANTTSATSARTPFLASRALGITSTAVSLGSIAWYAHLTGHVDLNNLAPAALADALALNRAEALSPAEEGLHNPSYPFYHKGVFNTFDHASIRRGYQVYREVCSTCHSVSRLAWRNLVGVSHTVDEVKAMSEEFEYEDGPDDEGAMFKRPGKLADYLPPPYANDNAARAANAGALPPDLSLMVKARHGGADYIFALLTGYADPPAGYEPPEGKSFNPYFPGVAIAMGRILYDGLVEYDDKTPATTSQMAKDVVTFLSWAAEPEHDERKLMGMQATIIISALLGVSVWVKRFKWAGLKSRRIAYNPPK